MFIWGNNLSGQERIIQNVINLFNIRQKEVCFDRGLGINADFIDKTEKKITSEMITQTMDMIAEKEPRANISVSDLFSLNENGEYSFKVVNNIV